MAKPVNFNEYLADCPKETHAALKLIHKTIKNAAPDATELISYSMPAFKQDGMLVWFAAHTHHIGFYPGASGIAAFQKELTAYKSAKGSVQFPLDKPIPADLVSRIVKYKLSENQERAQAKKKKLLPK
jgi:uncharacterized protein YdhG (YjbR/CyaY superfamily)